MVPATLNRQIPKSEKVLRRALRDAYERKRKGRSAAEKPRVSFTVDWEFPRVYEVIQRPEVSVQVNQSTV